MKRANKSVRRVLLSFTRHEETLRLSPSLRPHPEWRPVMPAPRTPNKKGLVGSCFTFNRWEKKGCSLFNRGGFVLVFSNIYRGCTVCATVEGCCLLALSGAMAWIEGRVAVGDCHVW